MILCLNWPDGALSCRWRRQPRRNRSADPMNDLDPSPRSPRVLVVEDQPAKRAEVMGILAAEDWVTTCCGSADDARRLFAEQAFDVVVLDICLDPHDHLDRSGLALCREFRAAKPGIGLYLLTNSPETSFPEEAWAAGPNDYVPKSNPGHLLTYRLATFMTNRRNAPRGHAELPDGDWQQVRKTHLTTYPARRPRWRGEELAITDSGEDVLMHLVDRPDDVVSFEDILDVAKRGGDSHDVVRHIILKLRDAFKHIDRDFDHISSVRNEGYRWVDHPRPKPKTSSTPAAQS